MDTELSEIRDVQRLRLQPGDFVVVSTDRDITHDQAQLLKERVSSKLHIEPDRVLILGSGLRLNVLTPESA